MAKWADYCISAVSYDEKHSHIDKLRVHECVGEDINAGAIWRREIVVSKIEDGFSFITVRKGAGGKWTKGEDVRKIRIKFTDYIRTDNNGSLSDNLSELPEF